MTITSNNNKNNKAYPVKFHAPRCGYATASAHNEYCNQNPNFQPVDTKNEYNLTAGDDSSEPLHFWQLYSVIGDEPIRQIVTDFYTRVFEDHDDPQFRTAFAQLAPLEHHIQTQVAYWIDAMGGGRRYPGGEYRLNFHHEHNAKQIMTAAGAKRWMYHMRGALESIKFDDPRVKPCILEFLATKMRSYAQQFGWKFDETDMELYQD